MKNDLNTIDASNIIRTITSDQFVNIIKNGKANDLDVHSEYIYNRDRDRIVETQEIQRAEIDNRPFHLLDISVPKKSYLIWRSHINNENPVDLTPIGIDPRVYQHLNRNQPLVHVVEQPIFWMPLMQFVAPETLPVYSRQINLSNIVFQARNTADFIKSKEGIIYNTCDFLGDTQFSNCKFKSLQFINCELTNLNISNSEIDKISLKNCKVGNLIINNSDMLLDKIEISDCQFDELIFNSLNCNSFHINGVKSKKIDISGYAKTIILGKTSQPELEQVNLIEKLNLEAVSALATQIIISDNSIQDLTLSGTNIGSISIFDTDITQSLHFNKFNNTNFLRLEKLKVYESFQLTKSSLGKSQFHDVRFEEECKILFQRSNISEIFLIETSFPDDIFEETPNNHQGNREVYRQLKNIAQKNGDKIAELRYEKNEMRSVTKYIQKNGSCGDKVILMSNQLFNNHGQDWVRALLWLLGISITLFMLIQYWLGNPFNMDYALRTISELLIFVFNPVHKTEELFEPGFSGSVLFIDTIQKLISGYLLFQLVKAFRKYTR